MSLPISVGLFRDDIVKLVPNPEEVPLNPIEKRLDLRIRFGTDYWVYCLSRTLEPRLFVDFEANSCVVLRDSNEFRRRLTLAMHKCLPDAVHSRDDANYIDPLLTSTLRVFVPLAKHFRYTYQNEYRFVWVPQLKTPRVSPIDLTLGSLKDIADFIEL